MRQRLLALLGFCIVVGLTGCGGDAKTVIGQADEAAQKAAQDKADAEETAYQKSMNKK